MTKKDYELIAGVLSDARYAIDDPDAYTSEKVTAWNEAIKYVAVSFALVLSKTDDRFDKDRFLKACEADNA